MPDYKNGKIYQIVCYETGEVYIGSTVQEIESRLQCHKNDRCRAKQIIDRGNYYIELLETYPCNSEYELNRKEGEYIRTYPCVNRCIAGRTKHEYYEDNKDDILKKGVTYRINNSDKIKNDSLVYYEKNNVEIRAKRRQKVTCECGDIVSYGALLRHKSTKKHLAYIATLT